MKLFRLVNGGSTVLKFLVGALHVALPHCPSESSIQKHNAHPILFLPVRFHEDLQERMTRLILK